MIKGKLRPYYTEYVCVCVCLRSCVCHKTHNKYCNIGIMMGSSWPLFFSMCLPCIFVFSDYILLFATYKLLRTELHTVECLFMIEWNVYGNSFLCARAASSHTDHTNNSSMPVHSGNLIEFLWICVCGCAPFCSYIMPLSDVFLACDFGVRVCVLNSK